MLIAGRRARRHAAAARPLRVALFGNPNTGKTSLFNALCGTRAKTANFPGTTTAVRTGHASLDNEPATVLDLPGIYGFHHQSPETDIARDVLTGTDTPPPDAVIVVIDACNVIRNLVLVGELIAYGRPTIVALNMTDLAERRGITVDARRLSARLGVPVVPTVGRTGAGVEDLRRAAEWSLRDGSRTELPVPVPPIGATVESLVDWAERVTAGVVVETPSDARDAFATRMDRVLMHPVLGLAIFAVMAASLFYTLFALAAIPMDLIEAVFAGLSRLAGELLPAGPIRDLLTVGVVGGIAGTVVFLPQIALLFFFISLLEDTEYLARAAFVADRLLSRFGLPGHAFVPLLSAHACAVPAIMSTRLIPDRRDRLITVLVAPFMSCSARVPVYVMLTGVLCGQAWLCGAGVCRLLRARRVGGAPHVRALQPHHLSRPRPADGPRTARLQSTLAAQRRADGEGSGRRVPAHRGHRHHGDLHRDVVAQHASGRRAARRAGCLGAGDRLG